MPARLNRRRYREAVAALKEIIADKKTPPQRKLRAVETLLGIYDRHDRSETEKARRRAVEAAREPGQAETPAPAPVSREAALREAQEFLARMNGKETTVDAG